MEGTKEKEISMNVPLLDILKGICIIFVVMTHFWWPSEVRKQLLFPFWIDMAVPVFMVVSGYTNASSFKKYRINNMEEAYNTEFFWKRVVRFTSPVLIVLFLEEMVYFFLWKTTSLKRWIVDFSRGGGRTWQLLLSNYAAVYFVLSLSLVFDKKESQKRIDNLFYFKSDL